MYIVAINIVCPIGAEEISILTEMVTAANKQAWFRCDEDTWPPDLSVKFTPLLLVHHESQQRMDQSAEAAKLVYEGVVSSLTKMKKV